MRTGHHPAISAASETGEANPMAAHTGPPGPNGFQASREEIEDALARHQFVAAFQPIADLRNGIIAGVEALVRWDHPGRGLLPPAAFLLALSDPDLSIRIDDLILEQSLAQMRRWIDAGTPIPSVSVNLSCATLRSAGLVSHSLRLLEQHGLTADRLKLEILEVTNLNEHIDAIADTIETLSSHGIATVLDDFGTGYASLIHLKRLRTRRIKIDRAFIRCLGEDPFDQKLTRSLIDMARQLEIGITAEGIETSEQLALLRSFGCNHVQGYFIGRPVLADQIPETLRAWHDEYARMEKEAEREKRRADLAVDPERSTSL